MYALYYLVLLATAHKALSPMYHNWLLCYRRTCWVQVEGSSRDRKLKSTSRMTIQSNESLVINFTSRLRTTLGLLEQRPSQKCKYAQFAEVQSLYFKSQLNKNLKLFGFPSISLIVLTVLALPAAPLASLCFMRTSRSLQENVSAVR